MAEITPAILPKSYEELEADLDQASASGASLVQIDICDGAYVSNRTWPYLKGTMPESDQIFESIISQESALPHWENIDYEFDLMCRGAYDKIADFISAGATSIVVHKHSMSESELSHIIADYGKHSDEMGPFDVRLGVALMPSDKPEDIAQIADKIHFVEVMGIERIGYQGQPFDRRAIELVKGLKKAYPSLICVVDGGIDMEVAKELLEARVDRLVVGSALFQSLDFKGTFEAFKSL